jgi:HEAT repeat protein
LARAALLNVLILLWLVSLGIAAAVLLVMMGLIVARILSGRRALREQGYRRRLVPVLLGGQSEPADEDAPKRLVADLSVELIQMVRGGDRAAFVDTATRLGVPEQLRRRLDSGSARERVIAAEALAQFPDEASRDRLLAALDDRNSDVRLTAAMALAAAGHAPEVRSLVDRLSLGVEENSLIIVSLFEEIARQRPWEIKELVLDDGVVEGVKAAAIEALAASGDYSLVPLINRLALDAAPDSDALPRYLRVLGTFAHPGGTDAVRAGLGSPNWWVRAVAAQSAGQIGILGTITDLAALLDDAHWWVRFRAAEALTKMGEEGLAVLMDRAQRGEPRAREAAALVLAERGMAA